MTTPPSEEEKKEEIKLECKMKDGDIEFCDYISNKLNKDSPNSHQKGLTAISVFNMKTEEYWCPGIAYKKNTHDTGTMLNYCPGCGKEILNVKKKSD